MALLGVSTNLSCSYPEGITTWLRNHTIVSGTLTSPTLSDEGMYVCRIFVPRLSASTELLITLHVTGKVFIGNKHLRPLQFPFNSGHGLLINSLLQFQ